MNSAPWAAPRRERLQGCSEGAKQPKLGSTTQREGASSRGWPALPLVGTATLAHAAAAVQALHQSVHLTQVEHGLAVDADTWMGKGGVIGDFGQGTGAPPQPAPRYPDRRGRSSQGPGGQPCASVWNLWSGGRPRGLLRAGALLPHAAMQRRSIIAE